MQHGGRPMQDGGRPMQHGRRPMQDGGRPMQHGRRPMQQGRRPMQHGGRPMHRRKKAHAIEDKAHATGEKAHAQEKKAHTTEDKAHAAKGGGATRIGPCNRRHACAKSTGPCNRAEEAHATRTGPCKQGRGTFQVCGPHRTTMRPILCGMPADPCGMCAAPSFSHLEENPLGAHAIRERPQHQALDVIQPDAAVWAGLEDLHVCTCLHRTPDNGTNQGAGGEGGDALCNMEAQALGQALGQAQALGHLEAHCTLISQHRPQSATGTTH
eukprot:358845-Chlamydomonas_euryale.AAC.5